MSAPFHYDFDTWVPRLGSQSSKWAHLTSDLPLDFANNINLGIAEMDFVTSQEIVAAIQKRAAQGILGYTAGRDESYLQSIVSWMQRRYRVATAPEEILHCRGANLALDASVRAFTSPGDGVIIQPPVFQNFAGVTQRNGRKLLENHLIQDEDGNYRMNFTQLEELAALPEATMLILCNPSNPTGNLWSQADLQRLGEICQAHGITIVSDDVHQEILRQGSSFHALGALFPANDKIITIISLSKGFNMAGLQVCHMIIPNPEQREQMQKVIGRSSPSPLEMVATIAAYTQSDSWLEQVNQYIDGNVKLYQEFMASELPQLKALPPEATYLAWLNLQSLGLEPEQINPFLREKAHLQLNNGASYGAAGVGYVRINLATPRPVLQEALQRLAQAVGG
ncbi:MAG: PatB family C-S lyase [Symbiobacteriaceae bacterium]|nr:PatB family C-S lyase [Symbiobacteriaceae bacterium]